MSVHDEIAVANQRVWEEEVKKGCGYTVPWLDIDVSLLHRFIAGELTSLPEPMSGIFPSSIFGDVQGKDVLCLAAGGGQQSAVFGLLGARVTVVDLAEGQLAGDKRAAESYGYEITTLQADIRDLSCLDDSSFDLVFQATSMAYVPDVHVVYRGVARVLRRHGIYRVDSLNPASFCVNWDGRAYCIESPYSEAVLRRQDGGIEFRHYLDDIFNGLFDSGFSIQRVHEEPFFRQGYCDAEEGSWNHQRAYVAGGFAIVARNEKADS